MRDRTTPPVRVTAENVERLREAFRYAQGYAVPGWQGHMPPRELKTIFDAALDALAAELESTKRERDEAVRSRDLAFRTNNELCNEVAAAEAALAVAQDALHTIHDYVSEEYREGEKAYQVAIIARAALAVPADTKEPT